MLTTYCSTHTSSTSADLVCQLVRGAQKNDQKSIDKLCEMYRPMIYAQLKDSYIRSYLGDDAESIAWVAFLNCVHNYKKNKFTTLPGLLKKTVRCELIKACNKIRSKPVVASLEAYQNTQINMPDTTDHIGNIENKVNFQRLINDLSPSQRYILTLHYENGLSLSEISIMLHKPYQAVYSLFRKGIVKATQSYHDKNKDKDKNPDEDKK